MPQDPRAMSGSERMEVIFVVRTCGSTAYRRAATRSVARRMKRERTWRIADSITYLTRNRVPLSFTIARYAAGVPVELGRSHPGIGEENADHGHRQCHAGFVFRRRALSRYRSSSRARAQSAGRWR